MSGIYGVGASYSPYSATTFTSRREYSGSEDFKPGLIDPEREEKAAKRKRNVLLVAATAVAIGAAWFFTKGKGKGLINKLKGLLKGTKSVADDVAKGTTSVADDVAKTTKVTTKPKVNSGSKIVDKNDKVATIVKETDTKHVNSKGRKLVDDAVNNETVTLADQKKYDAEIAYKPVPKEDMPAYRKHQAQVKKDYNKAHQVQNNISDESKAALEKAKANMPKVNTKLNGVFNNGKAEFTLKDGKIVKIKAHDGRVITDPLKLAKYENKHGVDLNKLASGELKPAKVATPKAEFKPEAKPVKQTKAQKRAEAKKQAEIKKSWEEFDQANKAQADKFEAMRKADMEQAAVRKNSEIDAAWEQHNRAEKIKATPVDSKKQAEINQAYAQREAALEAQKKADFEKAYAELNQLKAETAKSKVINGVTQAA